MNFREKLAWHIEMNVPVFPLHNVRPNGTCSCNKNPCDRGLAKHPRTLHGWKDACRATDNLDQLSTWHRQYGEANWGIAMGRVSDLCCLDVDPRHGGIESLNKVFPDGLPETLTIQTGRIGGNLDTDMPGFHYYFLWDSVYARTLRGFLPGLDFLSDNSYTVAPGSIHATGGEYRIINRIAAIEMPENLKKFLREYQSTEPANRTIDWNSPIKDGTRDESLTSMAGSLFRAGMDRPKVLSVLLNENETRCDPPLEESQILKIVNSIGGREDQKQTAQSAAAPTEVAKSKKYGHLQLIRYKDGLAKYGGLEKPALIDGWLAEETIGFIQAPPGSYKTWINDAIHNSLATGNDFLGHYKVNRTGPSIKINLEDHPRQFFGRRALIAGSTPKFGPYALANQKDWSAYGEHQFTQMQYPAIDNDLDLYIPEEFAFFNFTDPEAVRHFEVECLQKIKPIYVSFDPFYAFVPADDNFQKAPFYLQILRRWREEYHCSFMFIHHMRKNQMGDRLRDNILGSQLLNAFQETSISATPYGTSQKSIIVERVVKDSEPLPTLRMDFDITKWTFGVSINEHDTNVLDQTLREAFGEIPKTELERLNKRAALIKAVLRDHDVKTWQQLANLTGVSLSALCKNKGNFKEQLDIKYDESGCLYCRQDAEMYLEEEDVRGGVQMRKLGKVKLVDEFEEL